MEPSLDYNALTENQQAAVRASLAPQLVLAGPGTGKTRVLVYRAAHLICDRGLPPGEVVLVTFTTKAAAQLRYRLAELIGPHAQAVQAGTIHHFAYRLIRKHHAPLGLPRHFLIADEAVTASFWQVWCDEHGMGKQYRSVMTRISRFKLGLDAISGTMSQGYRAYQQMLRDRDALDYDDLLLYARDLLQDHIAIRQAVQAKHAALLVDEFQDTDPVQYVLIKQAMHPERQGLFCVADDDQSIYGFRGAQPRNIKKYIHDFDCSREQATLHVLNLNYRSQRAIFRCAESVLDRGSRFKEEGEVDVATAERGTVCVLPCASPDVERQLVLRLVQRWIEEDGIARRDIAVFMPWNRLNAQCEADLLRAGIPCEASGTRRLMETPIIKRLHALLLFLHKQQAGMTTVVELEAFLREALPPHAFGALHAFAERGGLAADQALHALVTKPAARQAAGLLVEDQQALEQVYALVANLVALARQPTTVKQLVAAALPKLAPPLQLLSSQRVTAPQETPSIAQAAACFKKWLVTGSRDLVQPPGGTPRIFVHHTNPFIARVWTVLVRMAMGVHELSPARVDARVAKANLPPILCLNQLPRDEQRTLVFDDADLVVTNSPATLRARMEQSGQATEPKRSGLCILHLDPTSEPSLASVDPDGQHERIWSVDMEGQYESPSTRLFKVLQGAFFVEPRPLFPAYVMVDLETTGIDTKLCRVVQIGALEVIDGVIHRRFERLITLPGDLTDDERAVLTDVCHFDLDAFAEAVPEAEVWAAFCDFVGERPVVAYNGQQFDFRILERLKRTYPEGGARWPLAYDLFPDALELFPEQHAYSAEHLRETLLKEDTPTQHQALADCEDQQRLLEYFQQERARRSCKLSMEPLLTAVSLAMLREPETRLHEEEGEEEALFSVGYVWALRGNHPILEALREVIPGKKEAVEILRLNQTFARLTREAPFLYQRNQTMDIATRLENLLAPFAEQHVQEGGLENLLAYLALWGEEAVDYGADAVTLSTYHSAKGLEFSHVICGHVHDGAFPDFRCKNAEDVAESRRLLYVGMTRAKEQLLITFPRTSTFGHRQKQSWFLDQLPGRYVTSAKQHMHMDSR